MSKIITISLILLVVCTAQGQEEKKSTFGSRLFLPSLEVGYVGYGSNMLKGGLLTKFGIEYRFRNNNDIFLRLNYDNRDASYKLQEPALTNVVEGKVGFSDLIFGLGYRFGDNTFRMFGLLQAGQMYYSYPEFEQQGNTIVIREPNRTMVITRATLGFEYYLDEKTAITLEFLQSAFWKQQDFWEDHQGSFGFSVGVITSLF